MFIEQAACSGVEGRANLTVAAVAVSMILAPLHCGVFGTNDILEHTAGRGPFRRPRRRDPNPKALKDNSLRHQPGDGRQ